MVYETIQLRKGERQRVFGDRKGFLCGKVRLFFLGKMIGFFKTGKRKSQGKTREFKNISKATSASQEGVWKMELKMVQVRRLKFVKIWLIYINQKLFIIMKFS